MNILYVVNRFPKLSESFVINEIHELERRGHRVAVFSLRKPEIDMQHEEVENLDTRSDIYQIQEFDRHFRRLEDGVWTGVFFSACCTPRRLCTTLVRPTSLVIF